MSEFRRNPYARAALLAIMARLKTDPREQEALLAEAAGLLRPVHRSDHVALLLLCPAFC